MTFNCGAFSFITISAAYFDRRLSRIHEMYAVVCLNGIVSMFGVCTTIKKFSKHTKEKITDNFYFLKQIFHVYYTGYGRVDIMIS